MAHVVPVGDPSHDVAAGDGIGAIAPPWDFCPFVWNGEWSEGALVRVSRTDVLNVSAGAAVDFPWFVVGEAEP